MSASRRRFLQCAAAAGVLLSSRPVSVGAQSLGRNRGTLKAVMQADLRSFDPVWTTATITGSHAALVYDTLFGLDEQLAPQPQMVSRYGLSDDKLTYTFELRDGLRFSDGSPVTSADCVASMRRWAARDLAGQLLFQSVADTPVKDDRTFQIVLRERYGLVLDTLGKTSNSLWIMRRKEAETDPTQQISEIVGSGPYVFNRNATKMGAIYVYDRNDSYRPREGAPSGTTGAKVAKLDRIVWENMPDEQTAIAALQAGEIDFYETPPIEFIDQLESDHGVKTEVLNKLGNVGFIRLNWLHPPFNNQKAREAMLYVINQTDIMKAAFGNEKYFRTCNSLFGCGTNMENHENVGWFDHGQDLKKAAALFKEAGYDGRPVVILQPTNLALLNTTAQLLAEWLKQAGVNAQLAASDWGGVVARRAVQAPPEQGGWNIFATWNPTSTFASPVSFPGHAANGTKGFIGWPENAEWEAARREWTRAETLSERQEIAKKMQANGWNFVPEILTGQFVAPVAYRANVRGFLSISDLIPFWNVEKT
ncbi:ABC transporter substrate-binding protein [Bradyrhizobium sp. BR 10289]|uniref:ABC transporter substrate-binding protein n=1 Tax=Bradyrhizobium sp. BR 10289 TaxID=2749993 RepID=UPI001C653405|nr:ABC transporter substrate-binding protein [Bradyrhizobium sp. BR 10289]MBW7970203.1 ABC transporter substrate-binding protein [Bradyrhizobium sp. BR 10289]